MQDRRISAAAFKDFDPACNIGGSTRFGFFFNTGFYQFDCFFNVF